MRNFKLGLFNKLLGFLLLCLLCSGAVAVVLIHWQMTDLAYTQLRALFESDVRNVRAFLQGKGAWLLAAARDLAKDELLKTGFELEVFDQVKNLAERHKTTLGLSEVMVINAQNRLVSRGDASRDALDAHVDAALADKAFGAIQFGGLYSAVRAIHAIDTGRQTARPCGGHAAARPRLFSGAEGRARERRHRLCRRPRSRLHLCGVTGPLTTYSGCPRVVQGLARTVYRHGTGLG